MRKPVSRRAVLKASGGGGTMTEEIKTHYARLFRV
ncbi:hypothetical protein ACVIW0_000217 [Bradyrhizobium sp. USDA 4454]